MAFQARDRDPLLDSSMAEAIEKRGKELLGLVFLTLGMLAALMIASYHPDDPNWLLATDAPAQNWLGPIGAGIVSPLFIIVGFGTWGLAVVPLVWGARLMLHLGGERALSRLIFAPIWIATLALYAASLTPGEGWSATHSFGLGGLFGDTVLGALLGLLPVSATFGLKLLSLALGAFVLIFGAFILGGTRAEFARFVRFCILGVILVYSTLRAALGHGARGGSWVAKAAYLRLAALRLFRAEGRRHARASAEAEARIPEPRVRRPDEPDYATTDETADLGYAMPVAPERKSGLLAALLRRPGRATDPEQEDALDEAGFVQPAPGDRVSAKIADVIRSRTGRGLMVPPSAAAEPSLIKGLGRKPDPLIFNSSGAPGLRAEPPLSASVAASLATDDVAADSLIEAVHDMPFPQTQAMPEREPETKRVVQHQPRRMPQPSSRAVAESQPTLQFEAPELPVFELPALSLLSNPSKITRHYLSDEALEENARMLENVLDDYGVKGEIVSVRPGPVVTMYELEPAPGLKASRVIGLADDIARSMSALSARVSTVPGRSVIGIELPNENREMVVLRELLSAREYGDGNQKLPLALGKDIGGDPVVSSLAKMPHLLIAGTTGSGKSVAINTMILSLLYKLSPDECRLIMIDPKMLELSVYDGIPHLLSPVVTDPKKAVVALKWVVAEMEERYRKMSKMGVRNIDGYNGRVADALGKGEMFSRTVQTGFDDETGEPVFETEEFAPEKMPYIVVIVDEMADLMMVAGKEIEACIQRLAQMARASGIHLIMATQRPSVDVITGTIKANFPTRISFQVTSKVDSRTILGEMGAEQLLGMGDMLYMAGGGKITRCHGPFVSDEEVEEVVNHLKAFGPPEYVGGVQDGPEEDKASNIDAVLGLTGGNTDGEDALYDQAVQIAITDRKCSTSYIQRKLAIGYNKAARLVEQMEDEGIVSPANHVGKREILIPEQQ
ncbi:MAG: DNA translocase FtsK 4TM domain-containing protein [Pseudomonadota bacterium]